MITFTIIERKIHQGHIRNIRMSNGRRTQTAKVSHVYQDEEKLAEHTAVINTLRAFMALMEGAL